MHFHLLYKWTDSSGIAYSFREDRNFGAFDTQESIRNIISLVEDYFMREDKAEVITKTNEGIILKSNRQRFTDGIDCFMMLSEPVFHCTIDHSIVTEDEQWLRTVIYTSKV